VRGADLGVFDDRTLVARWSDTHDEESFRILLARYGGLMRRAAFVALGTAARCDPGVVDDAVQEACLRLLDALQSFRGESSLATFLAAVARRAALDELRKGLRHKARVDRATRLMTVPDGKTGDPASVVEQGVAAEYILSHLSRLPEPDRSLLYLRDGEDMKVSDLAKTFGLPEGTIKSKLARSRARIRRMAGGEWGTT
jgi:RNA polymerase sigma-70 factor (ECF subfamily)